jgi:hypothetical protein
VQINPSDLSNDSDPVFMNEFYTNLRILSQDLYKCSQLKKSDASALSNTPRKTSHKQTMRRLLSHNLSGSLVKGNGLSDVVDKMKSVHYFSADSMQERVKKYAQEGGIPSEYVDRYIKENTSLPSPSK